MTLDSTMRTTGQTARAQVLEAYRVWGVPPPEEHALAQALAHHPFHAPARLIRLIEPGRLDDPIAVQCIPRVSGARAPIPAEGQTPDPIGDLACRPVPGLVKKHPNRAVLLVTRACFMHCRFCFRQGEVDPTCDPGNDLEALEPALNHIAHDVGLHEVILSGGDPLTLTDDRLERLLKRLRTHAHVRLLRIHTRVVTARPARVTPRLVRLLRRHRPLVVVLHTNHPRELDAEACSAIQRLQDAGLPLLNQSVLLRGVNDSSDTLAALSWDLLAAGVTPYYLHQCDPVPGTELFRVELARGLRIVRELATRVPGHGLPRYVVDLPGGRGKVPVAEARPAGPGQWMFRTAGGATVLYPEVAPRDSAGSGERPDRRLEPQAAPGPVSPVGPT